jgi:aminopeptidase
MTASNYTQLLSKYSELIVDVGLNLQAGQRLLIQAPIEAADLVRLVAASAYQRGCRLVNVLWNDEQLVLTRFQHAPRDSFEEYPEWKARGVLEHVQNNGAMLNIYAADPDLLKDQDPTLIATAQQTGSRHMQPVSELLSRNAFNWALASYPIHSWAARVFPDAAPEQVIEQLWEAVFRVCRVYQDDPVSAWRAHIAELLARREYLTEKGYRSIRLRAPGTDLAVGLPEGHQWQGGRTTSKAGIHFTPNLPTEEVFTTPHKDWTQGVVTASMPLSVSGQLIEGFSLTFEDGRVTQVKAEKGEAFLRKLIETDEGAARLGEVALVPHGSLVSQFGRLFYNTLFDENAACHVALGRGFKFCFQDGDSLSEEAYAARGGNHSLLHIDFMIGSGQMDVDGLTAGGAVEPILRSGEWAFAP